MNEETMRKHYAKTPKETLINILIASREQIERLNNIINELENFCEEQVRIYTYEKSIPNIRTGYSVVLNELRKLKGNNKK